MRMMGRRTRKWKTSTKKRMRKMVMIPNELWNMGHDCGLELGVR